MERNSAKLSHVKNEATRTNLPALLGGTPVFEKTPDVPFPKLEQWTQVTKEEAQVVYEMTLRNELSGISLSLIHISEPTRPY